MGTAWCSHGFFIPASDEPALHTFGEVPCLLRGL